MRKTEKKIKELYVISIIITTFVSDMRFYQSERVYIRIDNLLTKNELPIETLLL